jgi:hypothetical protein
LPAEFHLLRAGIPPLAAATVSPPERVASRSINMLSRSSSSFSIERLRPQWIALLTGPIETAVAFGHFSRIAAYRELTCD